MKLKEIKDYLFTLANFYNLNTNFHKFAISLADLCENGRFIHYMEESRFESSLLVKSGFKARFIHYLRFKKNLPLNIRKFYGYLSAYRIIKMMKTVNFSWEMAAKVIFACGKFWKVFPNTIVSAEWDMKKEKIDKFTLYVVCGKSFGRRICSFWAEVLGVTWNKIYEISRNIDFFGVDFFSDGNTSFKIYNRYPVVSKFKLTKWEKKFLKDFNIKEVKTVIRVSRIFPGNKKIIKNDKTHFIIKPLKFDELNMFFKRNIFRKETSLFKNKKIEVVSIDSESQICEVYFD